MGRYTGPVCRLCRRAGEKLFLKGERCFTAKCAIEKRRRAPGMHVSFRRRMSDRGVQLLEKQKVRHIYGVLERQIRKYMEEALARPGVTGQYFLQQLERRLDNVVFRLGFAESRKQARQLVLHGHITVNGRKMTLPSYRVKAGDAIGWKEATKAREFFKELVQGAPARTVPGWLSPDSAEMVGKVVRVPEANDLDTTIEIRLIVEYYSR
jgi:small subunit ribosomal protein S4